MPQRAAAAEEILKNAKVDAPDAWAKVIHEAAQSELGIFALMILVLAFIAYGFFRRGPVAAKMFSFGILALGVAGWGTALYRHPPAPRSEQLAANAAAPAAPVPSETRQISMCTATQAWTGWIPASQIPPDPCRPLGCALGPRLKHEARITGFPPTSQVKYLFECRRS